MASEKWQIEYSSRMVKRMDRIQDTKVIKTILKKAETFQVQPFQGKLLRGKAGAAGIYSYRFGTRYGEMRLLFQRFEKEQAVYFIYVGTREEIYELLKRWL